MINQIGSFQFLFLDGKPIPPTGQPRLIQRNGVDGVGVLKTGQRGTLFTLRARTDAPYMSTAREMFVQVTALIEADPVVIIQHGYNYDSGENWKAAVMAVRETERYPVGSATGGLRPPSLAWLELDVDMVAIANQS